MKAKSAKRYVATAACVAGVVLAGAGCESDSSSGGPAPEGSGLTGKWHVRSSQWRRTLLVTQSKAAVEGTVVEPSGDTEALTGHVDGDGVVLMSGDVTGTGTASGDTMQGTYVRANGNSGSWTATRAAPEG
jgi:hypothetical protein